MRKLFVVPLRSPGHRKKRKRKVVDAALMAVAKKTIMPPSSAASPGVPQPANGVEDEDSGAADDTFETEHERRKRRKA